jgi:hypothetical protein
MLVCRLFCLKYRRYIMLGINNLVEDDNNLSERYGHTFRPSEVQYRDDGVDLSLASQPFRAQTLVCFSKRYTDCIDAYNHTVPIPPSIDPTCHSVERWRKYRKSSSECPNHPPGHQHRARSGYNECKLDYDWTTCYFGSASAIQQFTASGK